MADMRIIVFFLLSAVLLPVQACDYSGARQEESVFTQVPEIQEIKPRKPVKIKLKRNTKGDYSWDLSGDNADKVIEIDKQLRKSLGR